MILKTFRTLFFYGLFLVTMASAQVEYLAGQIIQEINPLMEQMIVGGELDEEKLALALDDATVKIFGKSENNIEQLLRMAQLGNEVEAIKGSSTFRTELLKLMKANQEKIIQALNRVLSEATINYSRYVFLAGFSNYHPLVRYDIPSLKIGDKNPHYNPTYANLGTFEKYKLQEGLKKFVNSRFATVFNNHSVSFDHSRIAYYVGRVHQYKNVLPEDFTSLINFFKKL